jgi:CP family cyanate transporter-like MFS transporter
MLTVFALLMQAGATLPAMTAVPLANAGGWQLSLASWSVLSLAAALPWVIQLVRMRRATVAATSTSAATVQPLAKKLGLAQLITSRIAVGTALFYAIASFNTYGMLAWLPTILKDSGLALGDAALAFSAFTFMTLPMAFITPILATRLKKVFPLAAALSLAAPVGYIGLILAPGNALAWAIIMGLGGGAFPWPSPCSTNAPAPRQDPRPSQGSPWEWATSSEPSDRSPAVHCSPQPAAGCQP